jgi:putative transposase
VSVGFAVVKLERKVERIGEEKAVKKRARSTFISALPSHSAYVEAMPRTARASPGGYCYHVMNRGNGRAQVFHKPEDFGAFARLLGEASERLPMRLVGWCLIPNHFHLVVWPRRAGDLSTWMQWLLTAHVRRYHRHYHSSGHVWQGRFKAFPIQQDEHLLTVLRHVERNPLRANPVERAEHWGRSSLSATPGDDHPVLDPGPVPRGSNWRQQVNKAETESELAALRHSILRGTPFGIPRWQKRTATRLGLESSLRPRGRPRSRREK